MCSSAASGLHHKKAAAVLLAAGFADHFEHFADHFEHFAALVFEIWLVAVVGTFGNFAAFASGLLLFAVCKIKHETITTNNSARHITNRVDSQADLYMYIYQIKYLKESFSPPKLKVRKKQDFKLPFFLHLSFFLLSLMRYDLTKAHTSKFINYCTLC